MDIALIPGQPPDGSGPLARFLPPLEEGVVSRTLEQYGNPGEVVLDPFGASPRLVHEAALAERAVVVAINNPVTRFVLQHELLPFRRDELRSALALLARSPKDGSRLEMFLLNLYRTQCSQCGSSTSADDFIWDRDLGIPVVKSYHCGSCGQRVEEPTSEEDRALALSFSRHGLQHAEALQRVAPGGDPDREHAEAAVAVYPGRAIYALITLINKLEQLALDKRIRDAAEALLLSAFDRCSALWGHPEPRPRPLQLSAQAQFHERNAWRALEGALAQWGVDGEAVPSEAWIEGKLPEAGSVHVYAGPSRDLVPHLPKGAIKRVLTVLPRPNQAFWTLCALWAAWLWGRKQARSLKMALRRRSYGWAWHASALAAAMRNLYPILDADAEVLAFVPEAEHGFLAAALAGFDMAGFQLEGRALRLDTRQAMLTWRRSDGAASLAGEAKAKEAGDAVEHVLRSRGEPARYPILHAALWSEMARTRRLVGEWEAVGGFPSAQLGSELERVLHDPDRTVRLDHHMEIESGVYWLAHPKDVQPPIADRVERLVVDALHESEGWSEVDLDVHVCDSLRGLLTPDRRFVHACLLSYGRLDPQTGLWELREEDDPHLRERDFEKISELLRATGERLGFKVEGGDPLIWSDPSAGPEYHFRIQGTAALGEALSLGEARPLTLVIPGGRAGLVAEKERRDPRVLDWLKTGTRVIKFRHVRRLATESGLRRANLAERLSLDPPGRQDPQMPLL